jgi:hypothetical protein
MKKIIIMSFALLMVSGIYAASDSLSFVVNIGTMTDQSVSFKPFYWTAGVELDLPFGNAMMFSPELILVGSGTKFQEFFIFPAPEFHPQQFFYRRRFDQGFLSQQRRFDRYNRCGAEIERRVPKQVFKTNCLPDHRFQQSF